MSRRKVLTGSITAIVLVATVAIVTLWQRPYSAPAGSSVRSITADKTSEPISYISFTYPTFVVPPLRPTDDPLYTTGSRYNLGIEFYAQLDEMWATAPDGADTCTTEPCSTSNIDWSAFDDWITDTAGVTVTLPSGTVASLPVVLMVPPLFLWGDTSCGDGSAGDPHNCVALPTWLETLSIDQTYTSQTKTYTGINYDNPSFKNRMKQFVQEACTRYNDEDRVYLFRINTGHAAETQPQKCANNHSGCVQNTLLADHQGSVASCTSYRTFVRELSETAADYCTNKPVVLSAAPAPCSDSAFNRGFKFRKDLWTNATTGWADADNLHAVGVSMNGGESDQSDADRYSTSIYYGWDQLTAHEKVNSYDYPANYEFGSTTTFQSDAWREMYWRALAASGVSADYIDFARAWIGYYTPEYGQVIDTQLGNNEDYAWTVFRDLEYVTYAITSDLGGSGYRGDFANNLVILTPTAYPQACNPEVKATATRNIATIVAGGYTTYDPKPCNSTPLPTPRATVAATPTTQAQRFQRLMNWQARRLPAAATMGMALDTGWTHYGATSSVNVALDYLDVGSDDFTVTLPQAGGVVTHTVNRTDTGLWQRESWTEVAVLLSNAQTVTSRGSAFAKIVGGATNPLYLHQIKFGVTSATPGPTSTTGPTSTATRTRTPTVTFTPSRTPTITNTPTPTSTRTATRTPTQTRTPTSTSLPTFTPTGTITPATATYTVVPSATPTPSSTFPPTYTPTVTRTPTATATSGDTPTPSQTPTITQTPTVTNTPTNTPTVTRTPVVTLAPIPSQIPGVNVYTKAVFQANGSCRAAATAEAPTTNSLYLDTGIPAEISSLVVCNLSGAPADCSITVNSYAKGYSAAEASWYGCYPSYTWCDAPVNYRATAPKTDYGAPCWIFNTYLGFHSESSADVSVTLPAIRLSGSYEFNVWEANAESASLKFGSCSNQSYNVVSINCPAPTTETTSTPTATATATITPTATATWTPTATGTATATATRTPIATRTAIATMPIPTHTPMPYYPYYPWWR